MFPSCDARAWAKRYDIPVIPVGTCLKCGGIQRFVTPFALGTFRGLLSDHLQCGEEFRQSVFVTVDEDWNARFAQTLRSETKP